MTKELTLGVYWTIGLWTVGIGVVVMALAPFVKRWMHLDTLSDADRLAGRPELAEPAAPGMRPQDETTPRPSEA